jgi:hypothetical protein
MYPLCVLFFLFNQRIGGLMMQERGTFLLCPRKLFPNYVDPNESISFFHLTIFLSAFCSSATFVWIGFCTLLTNYNVKKYNHIETLQGMD